MHKHMRFPKTRQCMSRPRAQTSRQTKAGQATRLGSPLLRQDAPIQSNLELLPVPPVWFPGFSLITRSFVSASGSHSPQGA